MKFCGTIIMGHKIFVSKHSSPWSEPIQPVWPNKILLVVVVDDFPHFAPGYEVNIKARLDCKLRQKNPLKWPTRTVSWLPGKHKVFRPKRVGDPGLLKVQNSFSNSWSFCWAGLSRHIGGGLNFKTFAGWEEAHWCWFKLQNCPLGLESASSAGAPLKNVGPVYSSVLTRYAQKLLVLKTIR